MSASIASVRAVLFFLARPRRAFSLIAGFVAVSLYVWYAAVRAVPAVRRRKAALRARRTRSWSD